ncbi:putative serine protease K12H4.7 [Drosophila busckii]|uniref:putative serine protease K12H4.7 n=1 Tax=Drosophila busckii TaxID=30019 RepID=UPI0014330006|nr:putative serine protease K12H4.7 [Drosophila busckii]
MKYTLQFIALIVCLADCLAFIQTLRKPYRGPQQSNETNEFEKLNVTTKWITQKLDNFDDNNTKVWSNRYHIYEDYFSHGSPIFVWLGGESKVDPDMKVLLWEEIAKEHNGSLIYTEHRFYGKSIPIRPYSNENLKYLSTEQALADVVHLIKTLKKEDKYKNSKVLVLGCSYAGSMAVWLKKLYPDLVVGVWASSAPLLAKVDYPEHFQVAGQSYKKLGGIECYNRIKNAISFYEDLWNQGNITELKKILNICDDFDAKYEYNRYDLFMTIASNFSDIAQFQRPHLFTIKEHCVQMLKSDDDAMAVSQFIHKQVENPRCLSINNQQFIDKINLVRDNCDKPFLCWAYQTCSEFGWYQSTNGDGQPFGSSVPVQYSINTCQKVFGAHFTREKIEANVKATNEKFGGLNPNVTNVYLTHGELDPWSKVGAGIAQGATIIPNASHCNDMQSITEEDSLELVASKRRLMSLVRKWLAE